MIRNRISSGSWPVSPRPGSPWPPGGRSGPLCLGRASEPARVVTALVTDRAPRQGAPAVCLRLTDHQRKEHVLEAIFGCHRAPTLRLERSNAHALTVHCATFLGTRPHVPWPAELA